MINHFGQRKYLNSENKLVSDRYSLFSSDDYKIIELDRDLSLDEISFKYYDTPLYYWIIGEANNISDPFLKVKRGTKVKVPIL